MIFLVANSVYVNVVWTSRNGVLEEIVSISFGLIFSRILYCSLLTWILVKEQIKVKSYYSKYG